MKMDRPNLKSWPVCSFWKNSFQTLLFSLTSLFPAFKLLHMNQPTNIEMKIHSEYSDYSLGWLFKGAHYHIWIDHVTKLPIKQYGDITLYKNSIADRDQPGYFQTRKLSGNVASNKKIIDYVYNYAVKYDLFAKADQEMLAAKFEEERAIQMKAANDIADRVIAFCDYYLAEHEAMITFKNRLKEAGINLSQGKE